MASFGPKLESRPYCLVYRPEIVNHCPGCTHTNWLVGRMVAECAFCGTVLPLRDSPLITTGQKRSMPRLAAA